MVALLVVREVGQRRRLRVRLHRFHQGHHWRHVESDAVPRVHDARAGPQVPLKGPASLISWDRTPSSALWGSYIMLGRSCGAAPIHSNPLHGLPMLHTPPPTSTAWCHSWTRWSPESTSCSENSSEVAPPPLPRLPMPDPRLISRHASPYPPRHFSSTAAFKSSFFKWLYWLYVYIFLNTTSTQYLGLE